MDAQSLPSSQSPDCRQAVADHLNSLLIQLLWKAAVKNNGVCLRDSRRRHRGNRWWTDECHRAWIARQLAYRQWRAHPSQIGRENYKMARNSFAHTVRSAKAQYWEHFTALASSRSHVNPMRVSRMIRREMQGMRYTPPVNMLDECTGQELDAATSLHGWADHFETVARNDSSSYDDCFFHHIISLFPSL